MFIAYACQPRQVQVSWKPMTCLPVVVGLLVISNIADIRSKIIIDSPTEESPGSMSQPQRTGINIRLGAFVRVLRLYKASILCQSFLQKRYDTATLICSSWLSILYLVETLGSSSAVRYPIGGPKWRIHIKFCTAPTTPTMTRNEADAITIDVHRWRILRQDEGLSDSFGFISD